MRLFPRGPLATAVSKFSLLAFSAAVASAQVYITTGQTGSNGKLPGVWTVTPGASTPASFNFGGGYFDMGVSTGYTYKLNVRAGSSSGTLLASVTHTAAELCPTSCSGFNNHVFTLPSTLTFTSPNSYYVELIGLDSNGVAESGNSAPDGLKNPTSFQWVTSTGTTVDLATTTAPGAPGNVSGTAGNSQISVSFTAPASNGGLALISYLVTAVPHAGGSGVTASCSAPASSCSVTGLTNGTAYDVSVQAQNIIGPGTATQAANNPLTPNAVIPATSYTFTGPSGGASNVASGVFTVTPNSTYTGTITVTPSGGGLSTPVVLTFNSSFAAQTFTVTPTATGPVTLTPSNNGSLSNASPLSYNTQPDAPTMGSATAGNGSISLSFTAPANNGGSAITGYTATCSPGGSTASGAASPLVVTGLTNGIGYTCTVTATNSFGASPASGASNSATPFAPATSFTFTGPSGGALNTASGAFTVTPNATYTGTITVTPSGGGLATPVVLTFSSSSAAQTFTVTPTATGPVTLTASNNGSLSNASPLSYNTPPDAPTVGAATAGNGSISLSFTAPANNGGSAVTGYTATCSPGGATASSASSPLVVSGLNNGTAYTCTVTATNGFGTSPASGASNSATPFASASSFTFTGPSGGALNAASGAFTITPNATYTGAITVTPSGGGLATPVVLTFSNSSAAQTFTVTPTATGPVILTASNSGSLSNASPLSYNTPPDAPTVGTATAGNGSVSLAFTAPANNGGSAITGYTATCSPGGATATGSSSPLVVTGLTNGTAYTCAVTATNGFGTSPASGASNSATPVAPASSFTFTGPSGGAVNTASGTFSVTPNALFTGSITLTPAGGGLSTAVVLTFNNSAAAQTFTITPAATGPITLTATNSGSLTNPSPLTYGTPSDAPVVGAATAGNGSITLAFTEPLNNGGSAITGYTATCSPGGVTAIGAASPLTITGLTNGTEYTCTVTATNEFGNSAASDPSNAATPVAPANSFSFTGPSGGLLNTTSGVFTVTPNALFTGTIIVTPAGGGLSTPVELTFNNSSAAQTFTLAPSATGPITLTPTNTGILSNPSPLTYNTPPDAPTAVTATAGNGSVTISFTAPVSNGGSPITGYTATCSPGGVTVSGAASPLTVTGLTNGTEYSCTVIATNAIGASAASDASNPVTPVAPANSFTFTGPAGGTLNTASGVFTVTPNALFTGTITVTPSGGGLSIPIVLTFNNSSAAQTFTVAPTAAGPITLTPSNDGTLSNPSPLSYNTPPEAPTVGAATAGNGKAIITFTAPVNNGGSAITGYTATCSPGEATASGASSPLTVNGLTNGTAYTCTVTATNAFGSSPASGASNSVTPVAPATSFTLSGPAGGMLNTASTAFTVTPNANYTGTITIQPSGGGVTSPIVLNFNDSAVPQTFTVTPVTTGPVTLSAISSGSLSGPSPLGYSTPPSAPVIGSATAMEGDLSLSFSAPISTGGSPITGYAATCNPGGVTVSGTSLPLLVTGLTSGTAYSCTVSAFNAYGAGFSSAESNSVTPRSFVVVNAASFDGTELAPGYIGSLFGSHLADSILLGNGASLPTTLGQTSAMLTDSTGQQFPLPLYFVSPGQLNFVVPDAAHTGAGSLQVTADGVTKWSPMTVNSVQPGIFSAAQSGIGPAIANVLHLEPNHTEFYTTLAECPTANVADCHTTPVQFTSPGQKVFLSFFGTGFRGRSSLDSVIVTAGGVRLSVLYSGAQPVFPGLDQLNVELPRSMIGAGEVTVEITVDGKPANKVLMSIQ